MFSNSQKIYAVYIKPDDEYPHETAEFVEEHASIWGFIFHFLWCFYHRLWLHGIALAVLWGLLVAGGEELGLHITSIAVIEMGIRLLVMFDGNGWRQDKLLRNGYILSDIVTGTSELTAKQRFFDRWLGTVSAS